MRVLIVLALIGLCYSTSDTELFREVYAKYHEADGLQAEPPSALKTRLQIFKAAKAEVDANNADDSTGWSATVDNQFSILSNEEKSSHLGLNGSEAVIERSRRSASQWEGPVVMEKRAAMDYISKLPAVKNQGSCGSCWAFGAMVALEYQVNRKAGSKLKALSEQQFLDCTYEGTRDGCNGGWPTACYDVAKQAGSKVVSMATRPYTAKDGKCDTSGANAISGYTITGSKYLAAGDAAMLVAVQNAEIGVISVAIGVYGDFFSYKSGIWGSKTHTCMTSGINHAVDVVGYGDGYWMVRNSWGSGWGAAGYIKMGRGYNLCKIATYGHYPTVTGQDDGSYDEEDSDDGDDKEDEEKEEDDGCGNGLTKCCDGQCLHEHMCPKCDDDDKEDEDDDEDDDEGSTEPPTENAECENWEKQEKTVCMGKMGQMKMKLTNALDACNKNEDCACVSCKKNGNKKCGLRTKTKTKSKPAKFASYICKDSKRLL